MQKILTILFFMAFLVACTPLQFAVVNAPTLTYDGQISKDVLYGQLPRQNLDIYVPNIEQETFPVVVFFHGGRWIDGSKDQYKFVGTTPSNISVKNLDCNLGLSPH